MLVVVVVVVVVVVLLSKVEDRCTLTAFFGRILILHTNTKGKKSSFPEDLSLPRHFGRPKSTRNLSGWQNYSGRAMAEVFMRL